MKLFSERLCPEQCPKSGLEELQSCSVRFQEVMISIHEDPFVFSLLERRRGQKGFRDLQGDTLQQTLENVNYLLVQSNYTYIYMYIKKAQHTVRMIFDTFLLVHCNIIISKLKLMIEMECSCYMWLRCFSLRACSSLYISTYNVCVLE